ncbi:hypothetical protein ABB37_09383 [Leptomonas pyrrhocoris]|uniref:Uncharacterized protein n=1 Tax=Leptomonas pyrrhocoris TaxID=157538 RepID=A0A0M9FQZ9_LEPPY|nr:hypothetical protein ABB37_09383 [Leptomonas pyrrhocoris]XP_015652525.1 hypothetical protein ABB37_09383 [Leptomonas pyrrhocoris]KPA74085.1 hypothetical protein ABB37_09383 [Leptomonas pyrrhocoris]KPA74086.1 hypothetical protein ABB37_09383 [Leptomonas pyrrhocoris]|eukprot:XP_015652524.1 hypothetical protein ABB37_09383 [Leptomonas pyrrhocoris]
MSYSEIQRLQHVVQQEPTHENYEKLVSEELRFLENKSRDRDEAAQRSTALEAELEQLRREIAELQDQLSPQRGGAAPIGKAEYCERWTSLLKEFGVRKEVLSFLLSYSAEDFKLAELSTVSRWLDTWTTFFAGAESSVRELKREERGAGPNCALPPTKDLYEVLDEVCRLQLQARTLVGRERYRRSASSDDFVDDFMDNQQQLKDWCHKQRETLSELTTLDDLVEFSNSFYTNVPVMDSNFLVLMEQSEALMTNVRVQEALQDVNKEWVMLTLETYDKLQNAASDVHSASLLEQQCAQWTQSASSPLREFLLYAQSVLKKHPEVQDAKKLATVCGRLLKEHDAHEIVCTHLADFTVREECVKPHSDSIKTELQSSLTTTVLTFPHYDAYGGRTEYKNRIDELQEWIDVKSQKGTYMKLLERLETTKTMIEEHADVLFPDDTTAP